MTQLLTRRDIPLTDVPPTSNFSPPGGNNRVLDVRRIEDCAVQPTEAELVRKKTFLEDNAPFPRRVTIA